MCRGVRDKMAGGEGAKMVVGLDRKWWLNRLMARKKNSGQVA